MLLAPFRGTNVLLRFLVSMRYNTGCPADTGLSGCNKEPLLPMMACSMGCTFLEEQQEVHRVHVSKLPLQ